MNTHPSRQSLYSLSSFPRLALALPVLCLGLVSCGGNGGEDTTGGGQAATDEQQAAPAAPATDQGQQQAAADTCAGGPDIDYLCGPRNAEDLVRVGDTRWLIASGMDGSLTGEDISGHLYLVNHEDRSYEEAFPGEEPQIEQDMERFGVCPDPIDLENFSAHGLSLRQVREGGPMHLYVTSHGAREAIEVFEVDAAMDKPSITWVGCVPMPDTAWTNSVVILPDGGFYATQFMEAGGGIEQVLAGEITGHVFEWHPGGEVTVMEGTEMSGANGIAISEDGNSLYVAAYGTQEVVRFDLQTTPAGKETTAVGISPDNLRWTPAGSLYTAGNVYPEGCRGADCAEGWGVAEVMPEELQVQEVTRMGPEVGLQGVSVALPIGDEIWLGTFSGDRLGIIPRPLAL